MLTYYMYSGFNTSNYVLIKLLNQRKQYSYILSFVLTKAEELLILKH